VVWDGPAVRLEAESPGSAYTLSTTDDAGALEIAHTTPGVDARIAVPGAPGLRLIVEPGALPGYVLVLGRADIAVLRLELLVSPLKSLFFTLTADEAPSPETKIARLDALAEATVAP
jgi:hypothetical protein